MVIRVIDFVDILVRTVLLFAIAVLFILFPAIFIGYLYVPIVLFSLAAVSVGIGFYKMADRYAEMWSKKKYREL